MQELAASSAFADLPPDVRARVFRLSDALPRLIAAELAGQGGGGRDRGAEGAPCRTGPAQSMLPKIELLSTVHISNLQNIALKAMATHS